MRENDFSEMQCPVLEIGEIVVAGEHVLRGYLDGVGDRETKFDVAGTTWHRTGDAGYCDENGQLWLMGRCAEKMILSSGKAQYPFAMEGILRCRWPSVRAAVMEYRGKNSLIVEYYAGRDAEEWNAFAVDQGLDQVLTIKRIPLDQRHNAKIDYATLRSSLDKLL
jgi:acyl-CoA synthetase (AMP-forming)/AMP-acid ligase II